MPAKARCLWSQSELARQTCSYAFCKCCFNVAVLLSIGALPAGSAWPNIAPACGCSHGKVAVQQWPGWGVQAAAAFIFAAKHPQWCGKHVHVKMLRVTCVHKCISYGPSLSLRPLCHSTCTWSFASVRQLSHSPALGVSFQVRWHTLCLLVHTHDILYRVLCSLWELISFGCIHACIYAQAVIWGVVLDNAALQIMAIYTCPVAGLCM